jgi:hypothetical protein
MHGNNDNRLAKFIVQQNTRYIYTVPSSGIYWNSSSRTHEDFLATIRDYASKDCLMDVLQETRRNKIEEVSRFCHRLIRYVREFIDDDDFEVFGRDNAYEVMVMESIEEQEFGVILNKFNISRGTSDPDIEYYYDKASTPTFLLRKLIKDLDKNDKIFALNTKMDFIGDIVNLLYDMRVSHIEHLSSIHARTYLEVILN